MGDGAAFWFIVMAIAGGGAACCAAAHPASKNDSRLYDFIFRNVCCWFPSDQSVRAAVAFPKQKMWKYRLRLMQ